MKSKGMLGGVGSDVNLLPELLFAFRIWLKGIILPEEVAQDADSAILERELLLFLMNVFSLQNLALEKSTLLPELANKSTQCDSESPLQNGLRASASTYQYFSNGDIWKMHTSPDSNTSQVLSYGSPGLPDSQQIWDAYKEHSHQTLSELKRQRAAANLLNHPFISTHFGSSAGGIVENGGETKSHLIGSRTSPYSSSGTSVYYTVSSGDPPLLKFKAPMEEMEEKVHGCCRIS